MHLQSIAPTTPSPNPTLTNTIQHPCPFAPRSHSHKPLPPPHLAVARVQEHPLHHRSLNTLTYHSSLMVLSKATTPRTTSPPACHPPSPLLVTLPTPPPYTHHHPRHHPRHRPLRPQHRIGTAPVPYCQQRHPTPPAPAALGCGRKIAPRPGRSTENRQSLPRARDMTH